MRELIVLSVSSARVCIFLFFFRFAQEKFDGEDAGG